MLKDSATSFSSTSTSFTAPFKVASQPDNTHLHIYRLCNFRTCMPTLACLLSQPSAMWSGDTHQENYTVANRTGIGRVRCVQDVLKGRVITRIVVVGGSSGYIAVCYGPKLDASDPEGKKQNSPTLLLETGTVPVRASCWVSMLSSDGP